MPVINVENVSKRYRKGMTGYHTLREDLYNLTGSLFHLRRKRLEDTDENHIWALRDVSFQIERGERVGIIGRNGSGKTTMLRLLAGITSPTSGKIAVQGRLGVLIELMAGFHPELTGRDNVYLNGAIMGMTQKEVRRKFDEIVAFAELEDFIDTPIKRYSSGMQVRLGFAVAAHLDPDILLVDEVLAVGDAAFQRKCLGKMGAAAQEGRTVVFVSHNMAAVASLCQKVIVLSRGAIQKTGDVNEAIADYMKGTQFAENREDLIDHPNREKGCEQLLSRFTMELENGVAYFGKPLTLRIGFNFPRKIATPQFVVIASNPTGVRAFTLISDYQSSDIPHSLEGAGEVVCKIHSLPLLPGDYVVSLRLWQPGEKLDDIENVASFRVEWMERGIGQFNWNSGMGMVYVDANWELCNSKVMKDNHEG